MFGIPLKMCVVIHLLVCFSVLNIAELKFVKVRKLQLSNHGEGLNLEPTLKEVLLAREPGKTNDYIEHSNLLEIPVNIIKTNAEKNSNKVSEKKEKTRKLKIEERSTQDSKIKQKTAEKENDVVLSRNLNFRTETKPVETVTEETKISDKAGPNTASVSEDQTESKKVSPVIEDRYGLYVPISEDIQDRQFMHPERKKNDVFGDGLDLL